MLNAALVIYKFIYKAYIKPVKKPKLDLFLVEPYCS